MINLNLIVPFDDFTNYTPTIPKLYWDVKSSEQRIKSICEELDKLICYANSLGVQININTKDIEKLQQDFEKFRQSGFDDYYYEQVIKWINDNMELITSKYAKMLFFGLTDDGYFCVDIPEAWTDITFDTICDYNNENYGHLTLSYDIEKIVK